MKKKISGLGFLLLLLIVSGCASRKEIVRFQENLAFLQSRMIALQKQQEQVNTQLERLTSEIKTLSETSNRNKADLLSEMSTLKDQTRYLQNLLDDTGDRMSKLLDSVEAPQDRTQYPGMPDSQDRDESSAIGTSYDESAMKPNELYQAAYLDLTRKNYALALRGFQEYLRKYPAGAYADNAQYWIGEVYYARANFATAAQEFGKVLTYYPDGKKGGPALLKKGYSYIKMEDQAKAKIALNELIKKYPDSEEAALAKQKLKELK